MTTNVSRKDEFLTFFSAIFGGKINFVEFFTQSYRDNPSLRQSPSTNCQMYAYSPGII